VIGCPRSRSAEAGRYLCGTAWIRAGARAFLARGWYARVAACALVSLAAVVWLGALVVLLRIVSVLVLSAAIVCCLWLVGAVWRQRSPDRNRKPGSLARSMWARIGGQFVQQASSAAKQCDTEGTEGIAQTGSTAVDLVDIRRSIEALSAEFAGCNGCLHRDLDRWQLEIGSQITALREIVDRVTRFEHDGVRTITLPSGRLSTPGPAVSPPHATPPGSASELDINTSARAEYRAALAEIEADIRLEKLDEREHILADREERLNRRERELSAFVSQTQAQLTIGPHVSRRQWQALAAQPEACQD
jgi:hypothetical protein